MMTTIMMLKQQRKQQLKPQLTLRQVHLVRQVPVHLVRQVPVHLVPVLQVKVDHHNLVMVEEVQSQVLQVKEDPKQEAVARNNYER
jgi:hypothetical protein